MQPHNTACAVSTKNVILLTLIAKFAKTAFENARTPSSEKTPCAMENDLVRPFATNARMAAGHMDKLSAPRLANVQALLSLVGEALEYYPGISMPCLVLSF